MDEAGETVLDGRQNAVRRLFVNGVEKRFEVDSRHELNAFTEELDCRLFAERAPRALKCYAERSIALRALLQDLWRLVRSGFSILNSSRLVNDCPVEFDDCSIVQRSLVGFAHALYDFAFARMIAERYPRFFLRFANLE